MTLASSTRKARKFEALLSFDGIDKGDVFTVDDADGFAWAAVHVESGYLRDVTEEGPNVRGEDDKG